MLQISEGTSHEKTDNQPWVKSLVSFGSWWKTSSIGLRRIALISMPCDSPAAGLVALGAMIRDLGDPYANDEVRHFKNLQDYARQFLDSCAPCDLKCNPEVKRCGYSKQATGRIRSPLKPNKTFKVSSETNHEEDALAFVYENGEKKLTYKIKPQHALDWHKEEDPPVEVRKVEERLLLYPYNDLSEGVEIVQENLSRTYSGLVFAGRASGETTTREICNEFCFINDQNKYPLAELLSIYNWHQGRVSRIVYFNTRTEACDRQPILPSLVVADGDSAFLRVFDRPEFQHTDVIGVVNRNVSNDRLVSVGHKIRPNIWYESDTETTQKLKELPKGISISIIKRRHKT